MMATKVMKIVKASPAPQCPEIEQSATIEQGDCLGA